MRAQAPVFTQMLLYTLPAEPIAGQDKWRGWEGEMKITRDSAPGWRCSGLRADGRLAASHGEAPGPAHTPSLGSSHTSFLSSFSG